ncbi:MAG TPA: 30S ribosomal protein S16 [Chloroflexota bacterium]|nr:30S ribosomal protein S16 [Chloroflexota bacterium]
MLRIRLTRTGAKKRPSYRVVVAESRTPREGRHVDIVGFYDPMTNPSTVRIDTERAVRWLRNGAQPTERVRILLRHAGVLKAWEEARLADKRARREAAAAAGEAAADATPATRTPRARTQQEQAEPAPDTTAPARTRSRRAAGE